MVSKTVYSFLAQTSRGLEDILIKEIESFGLKAKSLQKSGLLKRINK